MEILRGAATTIRFPALGGEAVSFAEEPTVEAIQDSTGKAVEGLPEPSKKEAGGETFYELDLPAFPEVEMLCLKWTDSKAGGNSYQQWIEVVGGFIVSVPTIIAKLGPDRPPEEVALAREIATKEIESACGIALRPRYRRERVSGKGKRRLILGRSGLLGVLAISVNGDAMSPTELSALSLDPMGVIEAESIWSAGRKNIEVIYTYGFEHFPAAAMPIRDYAAYLLTEQPSDWQGRASSFTNEFGATYSLITPGVRGARFPLPSVNAFVEGFEAPLIA